jgi:serine/threonine-protein phosphatase 2A regulatory subunit A
LDDDDEALSALAEVLGNFGPLVGGASYIDLTFGCLEPLCSVEDIVVSENAVNSLEKLISQMEGVDTTPCFDLVSRLSTGDWHTMKCSACSLIPIVYKICNESQKEELIKFFL